MSIAVATPDALISKSFLEEVWTAISIFPFAVATIPFRLNCPATCRYAPVSGIVVAAPGAPFFESATR